MTDEQLQAINCPTSCVVAAGAGSGKTSVLSQRFVYLVKEGKANCDQILTITFTKKATAEMKERIHKVLLEEKLYDQLKLFLNSWISTVDSFCAEIARTDCHNYGFPCNFKMLDQDEFLLQTRRIALGFLEKESNSSIVYKLLEYTSVDALISLLQALSNSFNIVHPLNYQEQSDYLFNCISQICANLKNTIKDASEDYIKVAGSEPKLEENVKVLSALLDDFTDEHLYNLSLSRSFGSAELKTQILSYRKQIVNAIDKLKLFSSVVNSKDFVLSFYKLVSGFEKEVYDFKKKTCSLSFADVMQLAIDILTNNKAIRKQFKNLFKFVMVDEFQDNNDDYRKLIFLICEKLDKERVGIPEASDIENGKIFLVGDEKQSIYRFRGADVSVFKNMSNLLASSGGKMIELKKNFRSEPALVQFFNKIFERVMADNNQSYEACFKTLQFRDSRSTKSRIIFHNYVYSDSQKEDENGNELCTPIQAEAFSIAKLIKEMTQTDNFLVCDKNNNVHRPKYNEIAILLRKLSHQGEFEKALRLSGIPYSVEQARATFREAVVNDFYSLINLSIYPYDKISEVAVENSPFGGLESAQELAKKVKQVSENGRIAEVLDYIYYNLAYRQFLIANPANQVYQEHYDWLFSLACDFDRNGWNIIRFLDYLRKSLGKDEKSKEITVLREENVGVQIMTIHKSKGLEFPIVIVADMNSSNKRGGEKLEFAKREESYLLPVIVNEKQQLKNLSEVIEPDLEKKKELAELKRLFYVAATRAETHLVFSSSIKLFKEENDEKEETLCSLFCKTTGFNPEENKFENPEFNDIEITNFKQIPVQETFSKQRIDTNSIIENQTWYNNCKTINPDYSSSIVGVTSLINENLETLKNKQSLASVTSDSIISKYELQTVFGTMVHSIIESRIKNTNQQLQKIDNLSDSENAQLFHDACLLADSFLKSDIFKDISKNYSQIYSEQRFQMYDSELDKIVEGSMDMVCENEENVLIIDFKTDSYKCPSEHEKQLAWYEKAAKSLYPGKQISSQVVYLRENI